MTTIENNFSDTETELLNFILETKGVTAYIETAFCISVMTPRQSDNLVLATNRNFNETLKQLTKGN